MKVLYIDLDKITKNDIIWGLLELGVDVERANTKAPVNGIDYDVTTKIAAELVGYQIAISQNFSASIAEACMSKHVPYISWVYDSPQVALYRKEAYYPVCYKFVFDAREVDRLKKTGMTKVYHQHLASNITMTSTLDITDDDISRYKSDVSFVGKIYQTSYYQDLFEGMPEGMQKHFEQIVLANRCQWNDNSIYNNLNEAEINAIYKIMNKDGIDESTIDLKYLIETLMFAVEIAGVERKRLLNLAAQICDTTLYTYDPEKCTDSINCKLRPAVDAETDLYKVYYASKINLNVSLHSIETGIPQRVFDIMSVGGFVLSNYQEEIPELFTVDKEIVLYRTEEEFRDKALFYLKHDDIRTRIGINGYLKVRDNYTYPMILNKMLNIVCSDWGM